MTDLDDLEEINLSPRPGKSARLSRAARKTWDIVRDKRGRAARPRWKNQLSTIRGIKGKAK